MEEQERTEEAKVDESYKQSSMFQILGTDIALPRDVELRLLMHFSPATPTVRCWSEAEMRPHSINSKTRY